MCSHCSSPALADDPATTPAATAWKDSGPNNIAAVPGYRVALVLADSNPSDGAASDSCVPFVAVAA